MERYTKQTPEGGYTAEGLSTEELLAALGKYEDLYESVEAELELVRLNLEELSKAGKARSARVGGGEEEGGPPPEGGGGLFCAKM